MFPAPRLQESEDRLQLFLVLLGGVMNRNTQLGVAVGGEYRRQSRMTVQEKAVADDLYAGIRPVPPDQSDERRQLRMNGGFPAQDGEPGHRYTPAPQSHPAVRLLKRDGAGMAVIGVVRTAVTRQIAAMRDVQFQFLEHRPLTAKKPPDARHHRHGRATPSHR